MALRRVSRFLRSVLSFFLVLGAAAGIVAFIQSRWHIFDSALAFLESEIARLNGLLETELLTGISLGLLALVAVVIVVPLLMPKVNRKQFITATQRGIIASLVFFLSQLLYTWAEGYSKFWLIVSMIGIIILVFILIETLSLMMRQDEEVAFRTDLLASFTSGLGASIVIKLIEIMIIS